MALRPGKCYRTVKRPWTRQSRKKPKKGYVRGVPSSKIHRFESGKRGDFSLCMNLVAKESVQIRSNALEAARVSANKVLSNSLAENMYFLKVMVYPHQVLRENPLATGAGADRFQTGMRLSFGKPIGVAAIVRPNQKILEIRTDSANEKIGKEALKVASSKLPVPCSIISSKNSPKQN